MSNYKRYCYCCGAEYEYCPTCRQYASQPKWRALYDTEECKAIFDVLSGYSIEVYSKDDVVSVLNKYNIKEFGKYKPKIAGKLLEIVSLNKKNTTISNNTEDSKSTDVPDEEISVASDTVSSSNKTKKRKVRKVMDIVSDSNNT